MELEDRRPSSRSQSAEIGRIREWVNDHFMLVVLGPSIGILYTLVIFPLIYLVDTSLQARQSIGGSLEYVGLSNFTTVLNDPNFHLALRHTVLYSIGVVSIAFVVGLITALAINRIETNRYRQFAMTAVLLAWTVPSIVTALTWRFMLNAETGVLYHFLVAIGAISEGFSILAQPTPAFISIVLADAWARAPFATLLLLAGLQQIPEHLYEAARIDGASTFRRFRDITMPQLKPSAGVALLIMAMFSFRTFSIAYGITGGGPGQATEVLATWIYKTGIGELRLGYASALSIIMVFFTMIIVTAYVKFYQGEAEQGF